MNINNQTEELIRHGDKPIYKKYRDEVMETIHKQEEEKASYVRNRDALAKWDKMFDEQMGGQTWEQD